MEDNVSPTQDPSLSPNTTTLCSPVSLFFGSTKRERKDGIHVHRRVVIGAEEVPGSRATCTKVEKNPVESRTTDIVVREGNRDVESLSSPKDDTD